MTSTETELDTGTDLVITVTDAAREKVLEIRSAEDDADLVGLRIEIVGSSGVDFTYDLSFEPLADAPEGASVTVQGGLPVIVPAASLVSLQGSTLDLPTNGAQGGLVIRNPNRPNPLAGVDLELTGSLAEKVTTLLDQSVNPALAAHGGFAALLGVDDEKGNVYVTMGGGCQGCAMSRATLTNGIKAAIMDAIPEVSEVVDATDHAAGENPFFT